KKKQGHRALNGDVIDAMIDQILAYRIVAAGEERDLQLRADTIDRADQHRFFPSGQRVAGAEGADLGEDARRKRALGHLFDGSHGTIGLVDVDARITVANSLGCDHLGGGKYQYIESGMKSSMPVVCIHTMSAGGHRTRLHTP